MGEAYEAKESFYDFYDCRNRKEAENYLREWINSLSEDCGKAFEPLLKALHNWRDYILNYFDTPKVTNAFTESLNNLIQLVNRNGRGYSFEVIRAKILYSSGVRVANKPVYNRNYEKTSSLSEIMFSFVSPEEVEDYGASISTLVSKFEKKLE